MRAKLITLIAIAFTCFQAKATTGPKKDTTKVLTEIELQMLKADSLKQMNQFELALEYWEFVLTDFTSSHMNRLRALNESADLYRELDLKTKSKDRLTEARAQLPSNTEHKNLRSENLLFWGRYYSDSNQKDSALQSFRNAAFLAEEINDNKLKFLSWVELGNFYRNTVNNDLAAVYYYNKAVSLSEEGKVNMPIIEARTSFAMAETANELNEKEKAIDYSQEALHLMDSLEASVHYDFIADLNYLMATLYIGLNEPEDAIKHLTRAIDLRKNYSPEDQTYNKTYYYPTLSMAYEATHSFDSAILIEERLSSLTSSDDINTRLETQYRLAALYLKQGDLLQANKLSSAYLKYHIANSAPSSPEVFKALIARADYFFAANLPDSAFHFYTRSLKTIDGGLTIDNLAEKVSEAQISAHLLPRVMAAMEKIAIAIVSEEYVSTERLTNGLSMLEATLAYTRYNSPYGPEERVVLDRIASFHLLTEYALGASYQLYERTREKLYWTKALQLIENDKLIRIRKEAAEAMFLNKAGLPDSLESTFADLNQEILDRIDELELAINDVERVTREDLLIESFGKMVSWRAKAQNYMKNSSTEYSLFDDVTFMDFHNHSNIHLIEYFYGVRHVYGLSVSDSSSMFIENEVNPEFEAKIQRFLSHFWITPSEFSQDEMVDFIESSNILYNEIVAPLLPNLPSEKTIVLAPDGLIKLIPFETLLVEVPSNPTGYNTLPYLVKYTSISYITSAEMLLDHPPALPKHNSQLTSFALKSRYNTSDTTSSYIMQEIKNSRLYFEGLTFRGEQATKDAFIRIAPRFEILYLLIHGDAIDYPKLIFNPGKTTNIERNLYSHEIYNLDLSGNVIVLTSTETGMGLIPHGEAVISMVRAFLSAGSGTVVLGLWEAHDEHSKNIIGSFFKKLSLGNNTLQALRDAKLEYLSTADKLSAHPHNWAELISYGEPVQVTTEKDNAYLMWVLLFFFILPILVTISSVREKYIDKIEAEDNARQQVHH
ncbi:MAG: CHAT domain-containing protein [Imperialibacter sp.]|uniref:CHAT domain-containing protein n=1 Tax=Imperialibacter sp. TaxID=2038411 RepID=UPI0032ECD615